VSGSTVVAPTQPSIFESGIPLELIDDPMLIIERMKEFNDSLQDLFRFSMVCALNCLYVLLLSSKTSQTSFSMSNRPWPIDPALTRTNCELWRSNSSSCRPGSKRSKHKQQKMLKTEIENLKDRNRLRAKSYRGNALSTALSLHAISEE
jgi:hypothetical protein